MKTWLLLPSLAKVTTGDMSLTAEELEQILEEFFSTKKYFEINQLYPIKKISLSDN